MIRRISAILSLFLAITILAPVIASAAHQGCQEHQAQTCHGLKAASPEKKADSASHSHKCATHHPCCHSAAHMPQAVSATRIPGTALVFSAGYFFSVSSTYLESPFQPPEA